MSGTPLWWVDETPAIDQRGEFFAVTVRSGDAEVGLIMTRHTLLTLSERGRLRVAEASAADVVKFSPERRRRVK